ncbi:MAG: CbiX/SirB N-terminal domain-containing protein [Actinomycetota bacterium]|nr:CbiX/SirB N-terminal domain-containing protein [Actinomycetota bacterium]MEE2789846.1 CbiX/SirB N-terminal domain-containing protein [Myxococcota bacterium]
MTERHESGSAPHVLFVAHGSRVGLWNDVATAFRVEAADSMSECTVEMCFLAFGEPTFEVAVANAIAAGCQTVYVQPLLLAPGGHILDDIDGRLEGVRERHADVEIRRLGTLLELDDVRTGLLAAVRRHFVGAVEDGE